jgi:hypothetical protein
MPAHQIKTHWEALAHARQSHHAIKMENLFALHPDRFGHFSVRCDDLLVDYSKTTITDDNTTTTKHRYGSRRRRQPTTTSGSKKATTAETCKATPTQFQSK